MRPLVKFNMYGFFSIHIDVHSLNVTYSTVFTSTINVTAFPVEANVTKFIITVNRISNKHRC